MPKKDRNDSVHALPVFNKNAKLVKQTIKNDEHVDIYYDLSGKETDKFEESGCMTQVFLSGRKKFFVRYCVAGSGIGHVLNPLASYYRDGDEYKVEKQMGKYRYEMKEVKEETFEAYLKFLTTKNNRYLLHVEREPFYGS